MYNDRYIRIQFFSSYVDSMHGQLNSVFFLSRHVVQIFPCMLSLYERVS